MQAICQLDEYHADIARHGQHHFAKIFCLRLEFGFEFNVGKFADAIDQFGHFLAELIDELFLGRGGVFDDVMQQGRDETLMVHAHFRQDARNRDGVVDIGFTGFTRLAVMGLGTK